MAPDPRQGFQDTITSMAQALALRGDDTRSVRVDPRAAPAPPELVSREQYNQDMAQILEAMTLLGRWQDRADTARRTTTAILGALCAALGLVAALYGAFHHG